MQTPALKVFRREDLADPSCSASSSPPPVFEAIQRDEELASLIALWPRLPEVIRKGIGAMATAAAQPAEASAAIRPAVDARQSRGTRSSTFSSRATQVAPHQST